jgi:tryptophan halogenase
MREVLVLGGGSAGLIAAMSFQRYFQGVRVVLVRSPDIGIIAVGESTTPNVPDYLFNQLKLDRRRFYAMVEPTFKLGIHFLWGPRTSFNYGFDVSLDYKHPEMHRPTGYYCDEEFGDESLWNGLMNAGKAFERQPPSGSPKITGGHAFHLENSKLVAALEFFAREMGVEIIDGKMDHAERGPLGVAAIVLDDGRRLAADFFVDASGFRSELLSRVYEEPYLSYQSSLFNDRAILGSWQRTDEPILPYTTAETMDSGWAWQIEHEQLINRGYVFSADAISEEAAREEFARKNPKATLADRLVKFRTGRYRRAWVDNVLAVGNSSGFVEPLEATSLMVICWQCEIFLEMALTIGMTPSVVERFNRLWGQTWDEIRNFLALHFWANTRLDTPYWRRCRAETDISGIRELLSFYEENGPSRYLKYFVENPNIQFGLEGYLVMLVGNRVPTRGKYVPLPQEAEYMRQLRAQHRRLAAGSMDVREGLMYIRHPQWVWNVEGRQNK